MSSQMQLVSPNSAWLTTPQQGVLALLRIAIGWHFAYEGFVKVVDSAQACDATRHYLVSAHGPAAELFHWIGEHAAALTIVNFANQWGLLLIGVALIFGCLTRAAAAGGVALLALYYAAHPSLFANVADRVEGNYLLVNKNLVELLALGVVFMLPRNVFSFDSIRLKRHRASVGDNMVAETEGRSPLPSPPSTVTVGRRQLLAGLMGLPVIGLFTAAVLKKRGYFSVEEDQLTQRIDAMSGASMKDLSVETLDQLKARVPMAKIRDLELSRVILGGNLMNGFAHARDLIYVSDLIKSYHEEWRVHKTFKLAEACGINTILTNPVLAPKITSYWEKAGGTIKFIAQCKGNKKQALFDCIDYSIKNGASAAYIQGMTGDTLVKNGQFDLIAEALDRIRDAGIPAGIGGHYLRTIQACVDKGFEPDFWMKTLHHHDYWSSQTEDQHDNVWCEEPDDTITFMEALPQPWIAFKVLAAGSIKAKDGFRYAFKNGADFICVGMYDFQVVEDANIALDVLADDQVKNRQRNWQA